MLNNLNGREGNSFSIPAIKFSSFPEDKAGRNLLLVAEVVSYWW
jgi:hypothetical protein